MIAKTEPQGAAFVRQPRPSGGGPVALIILDGFGWRRETHGNAVAAAHKPVFDKLWATYPHTTLQASEEAVGLPHGQFGNSEVGHSNIGAGRILYQDLTRIDRDIDAGVFASNRAFVAAIAHVRQHHSRLHLCGLLSNGGVHSHIRHLRALLQVAADAALTDVCVHAFLDGRDVGPTTGLSDLEDIESHMRQLGVGRLATVQGRYYAMDRDNRWERTAIAYRAIVTGAGEHTRQPLQAVAASYERGVTDEFLPPLVVVDAADEPVGRISDGDAVILFNFRPDRAIQLSLAFTQPGFHQFPLDPHPPHVHYVCMTHFSDAVGGEVAYPPNRPLHTLGEVLAASGLTQLRIAETEKYPHVTFFFSGGRELPFAGEQRVLIPSPKVATYDLQPEMSAFAVAQAAAQRLRSGEIDFMLLNFANPDMVGHSGVMAAAVAAVEAADIGLGVVMDALAAVGGVALITADHGNADIMVDEVSGGPCTTHTLSRVPLIFTQPGVALRTDGILADLAPTVLNLLGLVQPAEMSGTSLLRETMMR